VISEKAYEDAVALAASLSWHFAAQNTEISFVSQGYSGEPDIYGFLAHLAIAQPQSSPSVIESLRPSEDYNIILTTRARGSLPTALWHAPTLFSLQRISSTLRTLVAFVVVHKADQFGPKGLSRGCIGDSSSFHWQRFVIYSRPRCFRR